MSFANINCIYLFMALVKSWRQKEVPSQNVFVLEEIHLNSQSSNIPLHSLKVILKLLYNGKCFDIPGYAFGLYSLHTTVDTDELKLL